MPTIVTARELVDDEADTDEVDTLDSVRARAGAAIGVGGGWEAARSTGAARVGTAL